MLWTEINLTYDIVDSYIFEQIPWLLEHFYKTYNDSDRELKYWVFWFWGLTSFFLENYKSNRIIIDNIVEVLHTIYLTKDKELQDLVIIGFIENLLKENKDEMLEIRKILKYPEFQIRLDELYQFWYQDSL